MKGGMDFQENYTSPNENPVRCLLNRTKILWFRGKQCSAASNLLKVSFSNYKLRYFTKKKKKSDIVHELMVEPPCSTTWSRF